MKTALPSRQLMELLVLGRKQLGMRIDEVRFGWKENLQWAVDGENLYPRCWQEKSKVCTFTVPRPPEEVLLPG